MWYMKISAANKGFSVGRQLCGRVTQRICYGEEFVQSTEKIWCLYLMYIGLTWIKIVPKFFTVTAK